MAMWSKTSWREFDWIQSIVRLTGRLQILHCTGISFSAQSLGGIGASRIGLLALAACLVGNIFAGVAGADGPRRKANTESTKPLQTATPEERAIAFLSSEVPLWNIKHKCFSCHNNGDAARALYSAIRFSYPVDRKALADTSQWLAHPGLWKDNGGKGPFSDKKLAAIQFAAALADAVQAGIINDKEPLTHAAGLVASYQDQDGSWKVAKGGIVGSPVTYGRFLATSLVRRVLIQADQEKFKPQISRADRWLRKTKPETVLDAAAVLLSLANSVDVQSDKQREHCLQLIRNGQARNGGWGAYVNSATEPFDTAIVLLALAKLDRGATTVRMLNRGREYLIKCQLEDGSWIETTRPAAGASYAQRLSTAGWATMALLATRTGPTNQDKIR